MNKRAARRTNTQPKPRQPRKKQPDKIIELRLLAELEEALQTGRIKPDRKQRRASIVRSDSIPSFPPELKSLLKLVGIIYLEKHKGSGGIVFHTLPSSISKCSIGYIIVSQPDVLPGMEDIPIVLSGGEPLINGYAPANYAGNGRYNEMSMDSSRVSAEGKEAPTAAMNQHDRGAPPKQIELDVDPTESVSMYSHSGTPFVWNNNNSVPQNSRYPTNMHPSGILPPVDMDIMNSTYDDHFLDPIEDPNQLYYGNEELEDNPEEFLPQLLDECNHEFCFYGECQGTNVIS